MKKFIYGTIMLFVGMGMLMIVAWGRFPATGLNDLIRLLDTLRKVKMMGKWMILGGGLIMVGSYAEMIWGHKEL